MLHKTLGNTPLTLDIHHDIVDRLSARNRFQLIAKRISRCEVGSCKKCGDVCPIKAAEWADKHSDAIVEALSAGGERPVWRVTFIRDLWIKERGGLNQCSIGAVKKSIRRSLDALRQPATIAIGNVDAWYAWQKWEIGATLLVAGPDRAELWSAFPAQSLVIVKADVPFSVGSELKAACRAKRSADFAMEGEPPRKQRGEYYAWLASIAPRSRLIRYGTDRHFNPLVKFAKPTHQRTPKRRKYPTQLVPYMYGNHPTNCQCMGCGGLGKYHRS